MHRSAHLVAEGFDFANINKEDIRFGHILNLPFRIRLGKLYRHQFMFRDKPFEIVLYNKYLMPQGTDIRQLARDKKSSDALWTQALIIVKHPKISIDCLNNIRNYFSKEGQAPFIIKSVFPAIEALNYFLVAYATCAELIFGGRPLYLLRAKEVIIDSPLLEIVILYPSKEELTDDTCLKAFDVKFSGTIYGDSPTTIYGDLDDLQVDEIRVLIDEHLRSQQSLIHHKLVFEAKSKMINEDYNGALLLAVSALEAVHSAFVQQEFRLRLPKYDNKLVNDFIRELGMSLCNKITPYLLMEQDERPEPELIKQVGHGLTIRNEIMHSLKNNKGEYRIRPSGLLSFDR
ncbi:hypothetical protein ACFL6S_33430 [Candidatus Poribacteria bacterium]